MGEDIRINDVKNITIFGIEIKAVLDKLAWIDVKGIVLVSIEKLSGHVWINLLEVFVAWIKV